MIGKDLQNLGFEDLLIKYPFAGSFFSEGQISEYSLKRLKDSEALNELLPLKMLLEEDELAHLRDYIDQMLDFLGDEAEVDSLTIFAGRDKLGNPEAFGSLRIEKGQVIVIVGPTGSGKSRLLADIEWAAQGDTPTKRHIHINDKIPEKSWRFSASKKLVAQLSQNMNFVMDLSVEEFLNLHAESRMVGNQAEVVARIIRAANKLAGESFTGDSPVTSLSGGQSRALMIADTAILSRSPIILIDEIENAGIDRKRALKLLLAENKIVLMATHDPILALMGDMRLIIKKGGIVKVMKTTGKEREVLRELEELDNRLLSFREKLRQGESLAPASRELEGEV